MTSFVELRIVDVIFALTFRPGCVLSFSIIILGLKHHSVLSFFVGFSSKLLVLVSLDQVWNHLHVGFSFDFLNFKLFEFYIVF